MESQRTWNQIQYVGMYYEGCMYLPNCNCLSYNQLFRWYVFNRSGLCHVTGGDVKQSSCRSTVLCPAVLLSGQRIPAPGAMGNGLPITTGRQKICAHLCPSHCTIPSTSYSACPVFPTQDTLLLRSSAKYHYVRENSFFSRSFPL